MTDEEYVRSVWEDIIHNGSLGIGLMGAGVSWGTWSAAAKFTRERLEQIRQVEEEIATTRVDLGFAKTEHTRRVYSSILAREQDALAELKQGMK